MFRPVLQIVAIGFLLATAVILGMSWANMPERVSTHFNAAGDADNWGSKVTILILPLISLGIHIVFSLLERIPHRLNWPFKSAPGSDARVHAISVDLLVVLKAALVGGFFYITFMTIRTAEGTGQGLGMGFLPVFLAAVFLPLGYFVWRLSRLSS